MSFFLFPLYVLAVGEAVAIPDLCFPSVFNDNLLFMIDIEYNKNMSKRSLKDPPAILLKKGLYSSKH